MPKTEKLEKEILNLDEEISKLRKTRNQKKTEVAVLLSPYKPGDVIHKGARGGNSNVGDWLVEKIVPGYGVRDYAVVARKIKKDRTPSKVVTHFDSSWDIKDCSFLCRWDDYAKWRKEHGL